MRLALAWMLGSSKGTGSLVSVLLQYRNEGPPSTQQSSEGSGQPATLSQEFSAQPKDLHYPLAEQPQRQAQLYVVLGPVEQYHVHHQLEAREWPKPKLPASNQEPTNKKVIG